MLSVYIVADCRFHIRCWRTCYTTHINNNSTR